MNFKTTRAQNTDESGADDSARSRRNEDASVAQVDGPSESYQSENGPEGAGKKRPGLNTERREVEGIKISAELDQGKVDKIRRHRQDQVAAYLDQKLPLANRGDQFVYGGPLSRSNYQTYGLSARKERNSIALSARPRTQIDSARKQSRSPKEVTFHYGDKNYQEKNKMASHYQGRRELLRGINIQLSDQRSSKNILSLEDYKKGKKPEPADLN